MQLAAVKGTFWRIVCFNSLVTLVTPLIQFFTLDRHLRYFAHCHRPLDPL